MSINIELFENAMQVKQYSNRTIKTYISLLKRFLKEFNGNYQRATSNELISYLSTIESRATRAQMHGVLLNFYKHVLKQPMKFKYVPFPKKEKRLPELVPHKEMLESISRVKNVKHKTMIMILYGTGIRVSELTGLKWSDIKREEGKNPLSIHVKGKGAKDRIVPISENLYNQLIDYCHEYKLGCDTNKDHYIFGNELPYSQSSVQKVVRKCNTKLTPHLIRHACFTRLADSGVDVARIQKIAGHEKIDTTLIYARLNPVKIDMPI